MWKWAAIVEHWAWAHCNEGKEGELQRDLQRPVDFTWMRIKRAESFIDPLRYQKNEPGESLLSVHRKRDEGG